MADRNEFDVFEAEENSQPSRRRLFLWIAAILMIAFVSFAGGMAYFTLNQRLPAATSVPAIPVIPTNTSGVGGIITPTILATSTQGQNTATQLPAQNPTATSVAAATAVPLPPTATNLPVATPVCAPATGIFATLANPAELGCPQGGNALVWSAIETFERGAMVWRSDTNNAYILFGAGADGIWQISPQRWDGQGFPSRGAPPPGLLAPERGFGYVWSVDDNVFNQLGWARQEELGFCALLQSFERGFILLSSSEPSCTPDNLYNRANDPGWIHFSLLLRNDGVWRVLTYPGSQPTAAPALTTTATPLITPTLAITSTLPATPILVETATVAPNPTQSTTQRPVEQGLFLARPTQPLALDGRFDEWPDQWSALSAVVAGGENFSGPADLAAKMQVAWSVDGLYLAIQVQDDLYRAGPEGTDMWKGDGLEIQFDRNLPIDYADTTANDDDFQVGVTFGPDLNQLRIYRWLPFSLEAAFTGQGSVVRTETGYNVEMLLPWTLFESNGSAIQSGQLYGFNVSVNDNDSDAPAQEMMLSASAARTVHNNPTQWGTLVIQ